MAEFQAMDLSNLSEVFTYKQDILSEFLNEFADSIGQECREKGEILKYIWNSMFSMIEHISE